MSRIFLFSIILLTGLLFLFACNNDSASSSANKDSANASKGFVWTTEDDNEFLADCIEEAKANFNYGEDTAFIRCNCALKQLKTTYQNYDSVEVALNDTSRAQEAVNLTKGCY
ncbi:MAG: hypothetical protein ACXWCZ_01820 [Flavisolibacter sp.]